MLCLLFLIVLFVHAFLVYLVQIFKKHEKEKPKTFVSKLLPGKYFLELYGKRILTLRNPNSLGEKLLLVNIKTTPQNTATSERPQVTLHDRLLQGQLSDKTTNAFDATGLNARNSSKGSILLGNFWRSHISPHP